MSAQRVVIVGGGFGGVQATRGLRGAPLEITLIDRRNFHLFQPLRYRVATGALSPREVAYPLRAAFKRNRNVRVLLAEVDRFDLERREVVLGSVGGLPAPEPPCPGISRSSRSATWSGVRGRDGTAITFPGVAPVAIQQGRYAAKAVRARLKDRAAPPFPYHDKGNLATVGRTAAVADVKGIKLSGFRAWTTWLLVNLFYVGFQNRLLVLNRWSIASPLAAAASGSSRVPRTPTLPAVRRRIPNH
jgi:NADH dehydrogenase FAD-containing subunit